MKKKYIQELCSQTAQLYPDHLAVDSASSPLSFSHLDSLSNRLANFLLLRDIKKADRVAILSDLSLDFIISMLGILKAGAAFVPLDHRIPHSRLRSMLQTVAPSFLLARPHLLDTARLICSDLPHQPVFVSLEPDSSQSLPSQSVPSQALSDQHSAESFHSCCETSCPDLVFEADDLAYVYFTSGSTGRPKGIAGRLKSIDHFIRWEIDTLGIEPGTRVSQLTSPSFDAYLRDVFVPLCSGGTVCIPADRDELLDGAKLAAWIDHNRINVVHCVPSVFRTMIKAGLEAGEFAELRWVVMAGEPLGVGDVKQWKSVYGERIRLMNLYGPSETTMTKFHYEVKGEDVERKTIPIGKPIRGAAAVVMDERGRPCAAGVVGEIYIRTPYRSLGYYADREATDKVFVANPFSSDPTDIVYKTGDLARILEDGQFEFIGRRDQQVKVRGVRVELSEIEGLLREHPSVKDAAVVDLTDGSGNKYLCAYVVGGQNVSGSDLRQYLSQRLPEVMVPARYLNIEQMPRTITGKVDRKGLPRPEEVEAEKGNTTDRQAGEVEQMLQVVWEKVLGVKEAGLDKSFFELGGHSLLATLLITRIWEAFGVEVQLRELFEKPTITGQARIILDALRRLPASASSSSPPPIPKADPSRPYPLSFSQLRLFFLQQLAPSSSAYNISSAVSLSGPLNLPALLDAFQSVADRHDSVRTSFPLVSGSPSQLVCGDFRLPFRIVDLSRFDSADRLRLLDDVLKDQAASPFDLATGPLIRVLIVRLSPLHHIAALTLHHIISDGWSMGLIVSELSHLYEAYRGGRPSTLPELEIQYSDYAAWQRDRLKDDLLDSQMRYWRDHLSGELPVIDLPFDRPRPRVQSFSGASLPLMLSPELAEGLKALSRLHGVTMFMTLLAAFKVLLYRMSGQQEIVVGTPVANRNQAEVEGLIGFFVNTLVLRTKLDAEMSFSEVMSRVREVALGAYAHQEVPFEKVVEELAPQRELSHSPLFQVMMVLHNTPRHAFLLDGLEIQNREVENNTAKFDLTLSLVEATHAVGGRLEYNTDLFDPQTVSALIERFRRLLLCVTAEPDKSISEIELLSREEQQSLIFDYNRTAIEYGDRPCLHELIQRQAASTPDAVALEYDGRVVSYGELNSRANRVAAQLIAEGVGPEQRVGICMSRSLEMVIALLGILKAGGAYVPLGIRQPLHRVRHMIEQSGIRVVITDPPASELQMEGVRRLTVAEMLGRQSAAYLDNPTSGVEEGNLAYVIYTSGSTGTPKGVMIEHRSVVNYVRWAGCYYRLAEGSGSLAHSPLEFDLTVTSLLAPLVVGQRVVIVEEGEEVGGLGRAIAGRRQMSLVKITPAHLEMLKRSLSEKEAEAMTGAMVIGGEGLYAEALSYWRERARGVRLINEYGPTETVVGSSIYEVKQEDERRGAVAIGRPIANVRMYVLDRRMKPAGEGERGEIYIGGKGVGRGYEGGAEQTAERFVPDPFGQGEGERLYRTGDQGRQTRRAEMVYEGRADEQVKVRGYRVEPGEIEGVVKGHEKVKEAAVVIRGERGEEKRIEVYVVEKEGEEVEERELRKYLKERLPEYMVPRGIVKMERMPVTSNGKVDRRQLVEREVISREVETRYEEPRGEVERKIASIWEEVLKVEQAGVEDNFFDLGGHSILMLEVQVKIKERMEKEVSVIELFNYPTIRSLAKFVTEGKTESPLAETETRSEILRQGKDRRKQRLKQRQAAVYKDIGNQI